MQFIKESLQNAIVNITRNKLITALCLAIITFTLLIFGLFSYITMSLEQFTGQFTKKIEAIFYIKENTESIHIDSLIKRLQESLLVENVSYISKSETERKFSKQFPDLKHILTEFDSPPFPASITVEFKQNEEDYKINNKIVSFIEDIERLSIIESKDVNLDWARRVLSMKEFISLIGFFLTTILFMVTLFIIYNVIKINILYRKDEIEILSLIGATDRYIKFPFIIEGAILGFAGGILSSLFLILTIKFFPEYQGTLFDIVKEMFDVNNIPLSLFIKLLFTGLFVGIISAILSLISSAKKDKFAQG